MESILDFSSNQWILSLSINFILILIAHRLPLLTKWGWFHAGVLGTILMGCLGVRGWLSVVIYLALGSLVTKLGFKNKKLAGIAEARDGKRGPENVWGSAATGVVLSILICLNIGPKDLLLLAFSASFAAKLADTFGSEIGKRWGRSTILITNLKPVPPGTDGGITFQGTLASLLGSGLMTYSMVTIGIVPLNQYAIYIVLIGFISTLSESFFGAIIQNKYSIFSNEFVNFLQTLFAALITLLFLHSNI